MCVFSTICHLKEALNLTSGLDRYIHASSSFEPSPNVPRESYEVHIPPYRRRLPIESSPRTLLDTKAKEWAKHEYQSDHASSDSHLQPRQPLFSASAIRHSPSSLEFESQRINKVTSAYTRSLRFRKLIKSHGREDVGNAEKHQWDINGLSWINWHRQSSGEGFKG